MVTRLRWLLLRFQLAVGSLSDTAALAGRRMSVVERYCSALDEKGVLAKPELSRRPTARYIHMLRLPHLGDGRGCMVVFERRARRLSSLRTVSAPLKRLYHSGRPTSRFTLHACCRSRLGGGPCARSPTLLAWSADCRRSVRLQGIAHMAMRHH